MLRCSGQKREPMKLTKVLMKKLKMPNGLTSKKKKREGVLNDKKNRYPNFPS